MIRVDCYLAVMKKFKEKYPDAHFEVITWRTRSPLAPTTQLLIDAGYFKKADGTRNPKMPFKDYKIRFLLDLRKNPRAKERLKELVKIVKKGQELFLVCVEKHPYINGIPNCHRVIIKEVLEKYFLS